MQSKSHISLSAALFTLAFAGAAWAQAPAAAADVRHHQGRGHRQRLYLPLPEPSGDVRRHARRRDRDRPDQLRAAAGGESLPGRDPQDHPGTDQVPDLQPPPLRPHRRRQGVQGRRRDRHRASPRQGAARAAQSARCRRSGPGRRQQAHDQARRYDARPHLHRSQSFRLFARDVPAEGEAPLRGRLQLARRGAIAARGEQLLSDRVGSIAETHARARLGAA